MDLNLNAEELAFRDELRAWLEANVPKDWSEWRGKPLDESSKASETTFGDATFHRERLARTVIDVEAASARKA